MVTDDYASMTPAPSADQAVAAVKGEKPDVDPKRAKLVGEWCKRAKAAREHWAPVFKRMRECEQIAAEGADEPWLKADNYVVPIISRHINQAVAQLFAKNPRAIATRKKKLSYTIWDGRMDSLQAAMATAMPQPSVDPLTGAPRMPPPPDPNSIALLQEVAAVRANDDMIDRMGKTTELLWDYFTAEQAAGFKKQMKALVRRTKVTGVGWCKLLYQRELEQRPEIGAQIDDTTSQISRLELLSDQAPLEDEDSARLEELRLLLQQLQDQQDIVVREGPVFDWPRSHEMYPDKKCRHLKTLFGARRLYHEFTMTPDEVKSVYGVDIGECYTEFKAEDDGSRGDPTKNMEPANAGEAPEKGLARVYEIQDKVNGQFLTVCEGYPDFLKEPAAPDVKVERFFTGFALVFNETENAKNIYPPSDVWLMRHLQREYNRAREALREHRIAAAPQYIAAQGQLDEKGRSALSNGTPHAVLEVKVKPGDDPSKLVKRIEKAGIDPNMYEVEQVFADMTRVAGAQEANLGGTGDGTATESSIAEQSRTVSLAENVDDLDEFLSDVAHATGQLMLLEIGKETVLQIVGPGAVWPDIPSSRQEIANDLLLDIKAGSSGRPNAAAELAKMERAMPYLIQMPGVNPATVAKRYCDLLDLDAEEFLVDGLPSITAVNAMMTKQAGVQPGTGDPATDPNAQGDAGGENAPQAAQNEPGPQPAFPAPAPI